MASEQEISRATHKKYLTDDDSHSEEEEEVEIEEDEEEEKTMYFMRGRRRRGFCLPRAKWIQEWNNVLLIVSGIGLFVDPLFLLTLSISETCMCLFVDGWFAIVVTALRCMMDAFHVWNLWLKLKMANRGAKHISDGAYAMNAPFVVLRYLKDRKSLFFDLFVILPLPQILLWIVIPSLIERASIKLAMTVFLLVFLFQYFPKIYHMICLLIRKQSLSGYTFGTVWWGISLNMLAYFVGSHVAGACWYFLGLERSVQCLRDQCRDTNGCGLGVLSCKEPIYYGTTNMLSDGARQAWAANSQARSTCIDSGELYEYNSYEWVVQLISNESRLEKIIYPFFWGLMTLGTYGNLIMTTYWTEALFNIIVLTSGLLLVSMLIGNIKLLMFSNTNKRQSMQLRLRGIDWWMRKRGLPAEFRKRVHNYERQRWAAMRGFDENEMIRNLPEGLRRDIKYHLCMDLVKKVPLFQNMNDLVLENICGRVKPLILTKGETITREGDPVHRMIFVVRGHIQSSQLIRDGVKSCCMLGPGNFSGDELLSWCLRRPFIEQLPPSSSTLVTLETIEAFGLEAEDMKYVTQHFRYTFVNEKMKRSARYYSPRWRTWAAVLIQLAWRRYKPWITHTSLSFARPIRPSVEENRLRLYLALLTSPKPNQEDFNI